MNVLKCKLYDIDIDAESKTDFKSINSPNDKMYASGVLEPSISKQKFYSTICDSLKMSILKAQPKKINQSGIRNMKSSGVGGGDYSFKSISDKSLLNSTKQ